jgi:hypothetical protein
MTSSSTPAPAPAPAPEPAPIPPERAAAGARTGPVAEATANEAAVSESGQPGKGPLRIGAGPQCIPQVPAAAATEQLVLELGGQIHPLAIRSAEDDGTRSLLVPPRLF